MDGGTAFMSLFGNAFWWLGGFAFVIALATGALLAFAPATALRLGDWLNREYSMAWLKRALDAPRRTEPFIYRHHHIVGFVLVVATLYFFWNFVVAYDAAAIVAVFAGTLPVVVLEIIAAAATIVLVIGNGVGFALGAVMLFRPSLLKGVEQAANTWVDTERAAEAVNRSIDEPEGLLHRYPRRIGVLVLVATAYIGLMAWLALG